MNEVYPSVSGHKHQVHCILPLEDPNQVIIGDWIEHLLSEADVTAAQTPTPDSETMESPPKGASEVEEDFMSYSG
jgi:hypothetical protein